MKKINFKSLTENLLAVFFRFHVVLIFVIGLAIMAYLEINDKKFEQGFNIWAYFILSTFISLAATLFLQFATNRIARVLTFILPLGAVGAYCFLFFNHKVEWEMMQFAAILTATILSIYFVLFFRKKTDTSFWIFSEKITRELIFTLIYTSILQGGLSLAIYAIEMLFEIKIDDKIFGNLAVTCFLIIAPIYFLMNIPVKAELYNEKPVFNKFLKILGLYVFLPILGVYLVILYFYLFKIIISWELPNGWVTTLVSILALGGYFAKFILFPISDNKVVRFLNQNFSILLFPLIILMSIGLGRRILDYGISINRLYVLIFNIWLYGASIYLFITKSKYLRWLVISFAAVLFISSVGPWSVYAVTKQIVKKDISILLTENKLYINDKLVDNKNNKLGINDSIAEKISDKINYYYNTFGKENWQKSFNDKRKKTGIFEITESLGINNFNLTKKTKYLNATLYENKVFDIQGYTQMFKNIEYRNDDNLLFKNKEFKIELIKNNLEINNLLNKKQTVFPLQNIIANLYLNENDETANNKILVQKTDSIMLIINNISADCKSIKDFKINSINITLLVK